MQHSRWRGGKTRNNRHKASTLLDGPDKHTAASFDYDQATYGNPSGKKQNLWSGLIAPGETGAVLLALSVAAGAAIYLLLPSQPGAVGLGAIVAGLALFCVAARVIQLAGRAGRAARVLSSVAFGVALGLSAGMVRVALVQAPTLSSSVGPTIVEGWVTSVEPGAKGVRLRIRTHAISGVAPKDTPKFVRMTHSLSLNVSAGRFVRCYGVLRPPPARSIPGDYDFQRAAWFEQLGAVGYVQGRCRGGVLGAPSNLFARLQLELGAVRRQVAVFVNEAAGDKAGGFAAALVSGDRSFMSETEQDTLRRAGLAHLLAISGLHLGIVGGLIYFVARFGLAVIAPLSLRVPVQKPAAIIALIGITVYLLISGGSVSTQRAFIMYAVFFSAILIDRPALSLRSFSIALICVVLFAPESVFAPGFQMSFAATGILIAIYEAWSRGRVHRRRGLLGRTVFGAQSLFVTSVAASLATGPFALFHFERLAPLGLVANLIAMPIVSVLSVPSAAISMVLAPFGLSEIGLRLFGVSLELIMSVSEWTVAMGEQFEHPLVRMPELALLMFVGALVAGTFLRRWLRMFAGGVCVLVGVMLWVVLPQDDVYWAASGDVYISETSGQYRKVAFIEADALGPLRLRTAGDEQTCGDSSCVYPLSGGGQLQLQRCQSDGAGCLCRAAAGRTQAVLLVSGQGARSNVDACANSVSWSDIEANGGVALRLSAGQLRRRHARKCGARPWRPKCVDP